MPVTGQLRLVGQRAVAGNNLSLLVSQGQDPLRRLNHPFERATVGDIDKGIESVEEDIAGMDYVGGLKMDKTVTIGVGMGHMNGMDGFTV